MRKSSGIVMAIVLLGFGGMMMAANVALKPYQRYAEIGKELTSMFRNLAMIEDDSKVFILCRRADEKRLAEDGFGMLVELAPSEAVRQRPGRLEKLTFRACSEALRIYRRQRGSRIEWFEVKLFLDKGVEHRSLIALGKDDRFGTPKPPIPRTYPPTAEGEATERGTAQRRPAR